MGRPDGFRVKDADPSYQVMAYVLKERTDAQNMITLNIPVDPMNKYIRERAKQGVQISHLALVITAYLRAAAEYKKLNWFVINNKIYQHKDFTCAMVVLKPGELDGTFSKMYLDYSNTIDEVQSIVTSYVTQNRGEGDTNSTDKVVRFLLSVPGLVRFGVWLVKALDKHGLLPKAVIKASPFHNSMCISNLASIRTNHIYHHCYNFGTTSMFFTMGNLVETLRHEEIVKCLPLGLVMDERIASGSYFAAAFQKMKVYLANPHLLEARPDFEIHCK